MVKEINGDRSLERDLSSRVSMYRIRVKKWRMVMGDIHGGEIHEEII